MYERHLMIGQLPILAVIYRFTPRKSHMITSETVIYLNGVWLLANYLNIAIQQRYPLDCKTYKLTVYKKLTNSSLSSYKKRPNRSIVQQLITTHSHVLKCSTSSGHVRNNMLPLIANAPEGRLFTNNPLENPNLWNSLAIKMLFD